MDEQNVITRLQCVDNTVTFCANLDDSPQLVVGYLPFGYLPFTSMLQVDRLEFNQNLSLVYVSLIN